MNQARNERVVKVLRFITVSKNNAPASGLASPTIVLDRKL